MVEACERSGPAANPSSTAKGRRCRSSAPLAPSGHGASIPDPRRCRRGVEHLRRPGVRPRAQRRAASDQGWRPRAMARRIQRTRGVHRPDVRADESIRPDSSIRPRASDLNSARAPVTSPRQARTYRCCQGHLGPMREGRGRRSSASGSRAPHQPRYAGRARPRPRRVGRR